MRGYFGAIKLVYPFSHRCPSTQKSTCYQVVVIRVVQTVDAGMVLFLSFFSSELRGVGSSVVGSLLGVRGESVEVNVFACAYSCGVHISVII